MRTTIGTARQPTRSRWCTIEVKRKVHGRSRRAQGDRRHLPRASG